jgi:FMN phosphatase YigB (HAD superfamily)
MSYLPYRIVIFDLGDVLFRWSPSTQTSIPGRTLKLIISSGIWHEYERGRLSEAECYEIVSQKYGLDPSEVNGAFSQARDSLNVDPKVLSIIRRMKSHTGYELSVYAMSNISKPDYAVLRTKLTNWDLFDDVFTSGEAGIRKPDLSFYQHVIGAIGANSDEIIFVDDKLENIIAARSLGICAIQYENAAHLAKTLDNLLEEPIQKGRRFLSRNAKDMDSVTDTGVKIQDNFAQLLILEATKNRYEINPPNNVKVGTKCADIFNRELVALEWHEKRWNFFIG